MLQKSLSLAVALLGFLVTSWSLAAPADGISPLETTPARFDDTDLQLMAWIDEQRPVMLEDLKTLVEINSGTQNIAGNNKITAIMSKHLAGLGFDVRLLPGGMIERLTCAGDRIQFADHLLATHDGKGSRILLSGNVDTVFPAQTDFRTLQLEGDLLRGPGVSDMKGGLIAMLYALKALDQAGLLSSGQLTVFLNTDEEMGSLGSRSIIEEQARLHDLGLVLESTLDNKLTRHRKGLGQVRLKVTGRASHAGSAHQLGVSAILELAHKIQDIEKLTDYAHQTTVNTGMIHGGEARNMVPPCADAYIDLRFPDQIQGNQLLAAIEKIADTKSTTNSYLKTSPVTQFWGILHRPAKPILAESDRIMSLVLGLSEALGQPLGSRYSGGGTDGSIMQAAGLPTADSLGVDGTGNHSRRETTTVSSLMERTHLAALLLKRLMLSESVNP